jgi:hypothetical protein
MEHNVLLLVLAGCCLFSCCVGLFIKLYFGDQAGHFFTAGMVGDAIKGFKFDTSNSTPIIKRPTTDFRPNSFELKTNFSVPDTVAYNIGDPQPGKGEADCSGACFDAANCSGYMITDKGCQLKGNVRLIYYDHGKSISVSGDVGGTKFGQMPFGIMKPNQPYMWSNTVSLSDAVDNCWSSSDCKCFTYLDGVYKAYANVVSVDSTKSGNTFIKFDVMSKSDISVPGKKYTDTATGDDPFLHIDSDKFKPDGWSEPPMPPPSSAPSASWARDFQFFKLWATNWNAGKDKNWADPKKVDGTHTLNGCAALCRSNASCMSFVYKNGEQGCYFRGDLSRDNSKNFVCGQMPDPSSDIGDTLYHCQNKTPLVTVDFDQGTATCSGHRFNECWNEGGSYSENGTDSYFKMQDPLDIQCPAKCAQSDKCKVGIYNTTDCSIFEMVPTVQANDADFTTRWKFDNFPG